MEKVHEVLPITKIVVETASFDIQKIKNPDIEGKEYQQGEQLGFWNVREYVLFRTPGIYIMCLWKFMADSGIFSDIPKSHAYLRVSFL